MPSRVVSAQPVSLTNEQARKIIIHAAGLSKRGQFGKGIEGVYKFVDHLGFVQIDTNYVVERAHHHSMWARVAGYRPEMIDQLQTNGRVFEGWTFATGYMPMNEFRFSLPVKEGFLARRKPLTHQETNMMRQVLDRIGREGPLMSKDFENDRVTKSSGWWDWRPSKMALERLHLDGRLITLRTKTFHKVYDITENVIPRDIDTTPPTKEEFAKHVIIRSLGSLGIATFKDIYRHAWYHKELLKTRLSELVSTGEVCVVKVEGYDDKSHLYMLPEYQRKKITLSGEAFILSPFDILNVFRQRLTNFFNFDYMVECFVPKPKRKYGYFALPILVGDTFVARMDSKADRKNKILIVYNLHFEKIKVTKVMMNKVVEAIKDFAEFNGCMDVRIEKSNDKNLKGTDLRV